MEDEGPLAGTELAKKGFVPGGELVTVAAQRAAPSARART
jgi:hypothetical protein